MKKVSIGIFIGLLLGILISAQFVNDYTFDKIIYTKITLTCLITGLFCGLTALLHMRAFKLFISCIIVGIIVFTIKYLLTGHHYNPLLMGSFTGTILGAVFYIIKKVYTHNRLYYRS